MNKKHIIKSFQETQKLGQNLARQILSGKSQKFGVVLLLQGELGAGKTTFLQGFARELGIQEVVNSPTFIIIKKFKIPNSSFKLQDSRFLYFYHFDCYRLEGPEEILDLGFKEIILNSQNIVAIEWPERICKIIPENTILIKFKHLNPPSTKGSGEARENKREIIIDNL